MRRRFFIDRFESNSARLTGDAAEHLGRVLRAEPGQLYELSDGERVWLGRIERVALSKHGPSRIEFALVKSLPVSPPGMPIEVLLSLVKFDRFEWCLGKATELGATAIVPLAAARTDKPLIASAPKRHVRWQKILRESAQQARRLRPPELASAVAPHEAFARSCAAIRLLLSERQGAPPLREVLRKPGEQRAAGIVSVAIAIGPEGGWMEDEFASARAGGFLEASLGETILRAETAVVAALAILNFALVG